VLAGSAIASARAPTAYYLVEYSVRFDGAARVQVGSDGPLLASSGAEALSDLYTHSRGQPTAPGSRSSIKPQFFVGSTQPLTSAQPLQVSSGLAVSESRFGYVGPSALSPDDRIVVFTVNMSPGNARELYVAGRRLHLTGTGALAHCVLQRS